MLEKLVFVSRNEDDVNKSFNDYLEINQIKIIRFDLFSRNFVLLCQRELRAIVLYEQFIYYDGSTKMYILTLKEIRHYESYEESIECVEEDVEFYITGKVTDKENEIK